MSKKASSGAEGGVEKDIQEINREASGGAKVGAEKKVQEIDVGELIDIEAIKRIAEEIKVDLRMFGTEDRKKYKTLHAYAPSSSSDSDSDDEKRKQLEEKKKKLEEERKQLKEERKKFEMERWKLEEERRKLEEERRKLEMERWKLEEERWKLEEERKKLEEEREQLKEERKKFEMERLKLKEERWELKEERKQLKEEREQLKRERNRANSSGKGYQPQHKETENQHNIYSWNSCIKRKSKDDVSKLMEKKILPSKTELNEVCRIFGQKSQIISDVCSMIGQNIKSSSDNITDVWPSYRIDYGYSENNISIIFVITIKRNSEIPEVDYEYHIKFEHEVSNEGKDVVIYEQERSWRSTDDDILEKMRLCINENSDGLFEKHRNLNVILPSLCRSTGYKSSHKIKDEPCIALYVTVKGYIPLNEDPFVNQLDCYKIDVLEGDFDPYIGGRPNDHHEHLKIGLAIHANVSNGSGIEGGTLGGFIDHSVHGLCGITCAHVLFNSEELTEIKEKKSFRSKQVYQPIGDRLEAFGKVVEAVFKEGNTSLPGMEFALIKINDRHPTDGSFPDVFNDVESGFDDKNPMLFNSGDVCETSHLKRRREVYKLGMSSGITRGSFELRGAAIRKHQTDGQHHGFGFRLKNQIAILQIGKHPFAEPGDSGSLVLMEGEQDSIAIGIVEGGIDGRTFVTPICDILRAGDCSELRMHRFDIINRLQENLQPHEDMEP